MTPNPPFVSVILTTRDRPRLLGLALRCHAQQTYPHRELIVVDDGDRDPADAGAVAAVGGRLIRVEPGTPLGVKLNRGVSEARGALCQKMDDDDWYAPCFLQTMVSALLASQRVVCRPTVAFLRPFLIFDLAHWEIRRSDEGQFSGASLLFTRGAWELHPFRGLPQSEDSWFLRDQQRLGGLRLPVDGLETFLAVRHGGGLPEREHTWMHHQDGRTIDELFLRRLPHRRGPEQLLPKWALDVYRDLSPKR